MKKIIFATGNADKMKEIRKILADLDAEVVSMKEAGIQADIVEDGKTFEENAVIKATAISKLTGNGEIVLADDSGLEIDYLNKEPGVYSARYMGENTDYHIKNANLIQRLDGVPDEQRTARFVCAIAAAFPDGRVETVRGTMEGRIGYEEKGANGFGYDPIFFLPEYGCTSAELSMEEKNKISHRGKALQAMKVLVVSDTHGRDESLEMAVALEQPFDYLIHCGDVEGREFFIEALAECPCTIVAGNNDFFSDLPREDEILLEGHKIMVTHGHNYGVSMDLYGVSEEAAARGCEIVCFGHTHKPVVEKKNGVLVINPGSLSFPRQEGRRPSYAVMELYKGEEPEIEIRYL